MVLFELEHHLLAAAHAHANSYSRRRFQLLRSVSARQLAVRYRLMVAALRSCQMACCVLCTFPRTLRTCTIPQACQHTAFTSRLKTHWVGAQQHAVLLSQVQPQAICPAVVPSAVQLVWSISQHPYLSPHFVRCPCGCAPPAGVLQHVQEQFSSSKA